MHQSASLPRTRSLGRRFGGLAAIPLAAAAVADVPATLVVSPGSTAVVQLEIEVTGADGTETQVDSRVVPLGGEGGVRFVPDREPFTGMIFDQLVLRPGDCQLSYDFFCSPIFGCVTIGVDLRQIVATLQGPSGASIVGEAVGFGEPWRLVGEYTIDSILFSSSGVIDTTTSPGFNGRILVGDGGWRLEQLLLGTIESDVPAENLPAGLSVKLRTTVGLGGAALIGNYDPPPPASCGGGGPCNEARSNAGCDDVVCCDLVCGLDPTCCTASWDSDCAALAISRCVIPPPNDRCEEATPLGLGRFPFSSVNADTDGDPLPTACRDPQTLGAMVGDVWFTHTPTVDNGVVVSTCGHAAFDTRIVVYTGCGGDLLVCGDDVDGCPGGTSQVGFHGEAGETYLIRVAGKFATGEGEIDIAWADVPARPTTIASTWDPSSGGNGHAYAVYAVPAVTDLAGMVERAAAFGGSPATLASPAENDFVADHATPVQLGGSTGFGLVQSGGGKEPFGGWGWITGEEFYYSNWFPGEPNDAGADGEDFGIVYPDGRWNDGPQLFGNILMEFDDAIELEVAEWTVESGGEGQRYRAVLVPVALGWEEARDRAVSLGGRLVCLETEAEADFVFDRLASFTNLWSMTDYNGGPWVGLERTEEEWRWVSGATLDWSPWRPGEPNGTGDKACFFSYQTGPRRELDDTWSGDVRRAFIVEFAPDVPCPADLDGDGAVAGGDIGIMLSSWGDCPGCPADLDGDDRVGGGDIGLILAAWGPCS